MKLAAEASDVARARRRVRKAAAAAAMLPAQLAAQSTGTAGGLAGASAAASGLRMVLSLAAVLVVLGACAWLARRWRDRHQATAGSIEVVSGLTLGGKERVVLLRVGDEQVLVGVSPAGMRSLHVIRERSVHASDAFELTMDELQ